MIILNNIILCLLLPFLLLSCAKSNPEMTVNTYPLPQANIEADKDQANIISDSNEIRLAAGDSLTVQVWGQDDLNQEITLDSTGSLYFPFVGKISASGMTIPQLQEVLINKLSIYYVDPVVTVNPEKLSGQKYYVLGEVGNPGEYVISSKKLVLNAVAAAGGATVDAGKILILLRKLQHKVIVMGIPLEYQDIEGNNLPSLTTRVRVGDILYLPPSGIADKQRFMNRISDIVAPILDIERGVLLWPALIDAIEGNSTQVLVN